MHGEGYVHLIEDVKMFVGRALASLCDHSAALLAQVNLV
jgi:hypothetical protein